MGVSKTCTNVGIYFELGRYTLYIVSYQNNIQIHKEIGKQANGLILIPLSSSRVGTDRYDRKINEILPRYERVCRYCISSSIEDELHFLLDCPLQWRIQKFLSGGTQ
jgi:hypothetical protein